MSQSQGGRWDALTDVARRCVAEKQFDKAEEAFLAALREAEQFGETDQRVAATLNALARVYHRRSKFFPAAALLHRLLAVKEREHGENHPELAGILTNLADMYAKLGDARQELELRERALAIRVGAGEAEGAPLETLRARIAELSQKIAEERAREDAVRNVRKRIPVPSGATDLPLILPTPIASPQLQPLSPAFLPRKVDARSSDPRAPLRSEAAVAPAPARSEPIVPVRTEPVAPVHPERVSPPRPAPSAPLRAEPIAAVRSESAAPLRPEPIALPSEVVVPERAKPVTPLRTESVAPLPVESITPLRAEKIGRPSMEPIAPPITEAIAPLRTEPIAPLGTEPIVPLRTEPIAPLRTEPIVPPPSSALVLRSDVATPVLPPVERTLPGEPLFGPPSQSSAPPAFPAPLAPLIAGIRDVRTPSPMRTSAVIPPAFARATFATPFGMNSAPPASPSVPVEGPFAPLTAVPPTPGPLESIAPPPLRKTSGPSWAPLAPPAPDTSWPASGSVDDAEVLPDDYVGDSFEVRPRRSWRPVAIGGAALAAVAVVAVLVLGRPETAGSASGELATPPAQVEPNVDEAPVEELPRAAPPLAPLEAEALQYGLANVEAAVNAGTAANAGEPPQGAGLEDRFAADASARDSAKLKVKVPSLSLDKVTESIDAAARARLDSLAKVNDQQVYEYKGKKPRQ